MLQLAKDGGPLLQHLKTLVCESELKVASIFQVHLQHTVKFLIVAKESVFWGGEVY